MRLFSRKLITWQRKSKPETAISQLDILHRRGKQHVKPRLHISYAGSYERPGERLAAFIRENNIKTLNVAGSRGSKEPKVAAFVKLALEEAFYPRVEAMVVRG